MRVLLEARANAGLEGYVCIRDVLLTVVDESTITLMGKEKKVSSATVVRRIKLIPAETRTEPNFRVSHLTVPLISL